MNQKPDVVATFVALGLLAAVVLYWKGVDTEGKSEVTVDSVFSPHECSSDVLPNCFEVAPGIYSGGQPDGAKGFEQLARMGMQTVISVDGACPEVQLAEQFDLRYVHLPHGYDGINEQHALKIAKAIASLDGPVYIHCHHGIHRSPASTAAACIGLGLMTTEQGRQFLLDAGTSEHYKGLYRSVVEAKLFDKRTLRQVKVELPSLSPPSHLVESMVLAETHIDALVRFDANDWKPLPDHPDLEAAHEALLLMEQFAELLRTQKSEWLEYDRLLKSSKQRSQELYELLSDSERIDRYQKLKAGELLKAINNDCHSCHRRFRD